MKNRSGGVVIVYVWDNTPNKQLTKHKLPADVEGVLIEVNLRKTKWLIFGQYHPPSQPVEYFFKHEGYSLDICKQTCEKIFLDGDFNTEETEFCLTKFLPAITPNVWVKMMMKFYRNGFNTQYALL